MSELNELDKLKTKPNIGKRIFAAIIDYAIIYTFLYVFVFSFGEPSTDGGYHINGFPALIPVLFWGIMTVGLEQWIGSTFGNLLVELKPISINEIDKKLTFSQSLKRHLMDPIDIFFFGLIGIITIKNTKHNQRLGDIWAKTIVVNTSDKEPTE